LVVVVVVGGRERASMAQAGEGFWQERERIQEVRDGATTKDKYMRIEEEEEEREEEGE
jgi:hypothetical protein